MLPVCIEHMASTLSGQELLQPALQLFTSLYEDNVMDQLQLLYSTGGRDPAFLSELSLDENIFPCTCEQFSIQYRCTEYCQYCTHAAHFVNETIELEKQLVAHFLQVPHFLEQLRSECAACGVQLDSLFQSVIPLSPNFATADGIPLCRLLCDRADEFFDSFSFMNAGDGKFRLLDESLEHIVGALQEETGGDYHDEIYQLLVYLRDLTLKSTEELILAIKNAHKNPSIDEEESFRAISELLRSEIMDDSVPDVSQILAAQHPIATSNDSVCLEESENTVVPIDDIEGEYGDENEFDEGEYSEDELDEDEYDEDEYGEDEYDEDEYDEDEPDEDELDEDEVGTSSNASVHKDEDVADTTSLLDFLRDDSFESPDFSKNSPTSKIIVEQVEFKMEEHCLECLPCLHQSMTKEVEAFIQFAVTSSDYRQLEYAMLQERTTEHIGLLPMEVANISGEWQIVVYLPSSQSFHAMRIASPLTADLMRIFISADNYRIITYFPGYLANQIPYIHNLSSIAYNYASYIKRSHSYSAEAIYYELTGSWNQEQILPEWMFGMTCYPELLEAYPDTEESTFYTRLNSMLSGCYQQTKFGIDTKYSYSISKLYQYSFSAKSSQHMREYMRFGFTIHNTVQDSFALEHMLQEFIVSLSYDKYCEECFLYVLQYNITERSLTFLARNRYADGLVSYLQLKLIAFLREKLSGEVVSIEVCLPGQDIL